MFRKTLFQYIDKSLNNLVHFKIASIISYNHDLNKFLIVITAFI